MHMILVWITGQNMDLFIVVGDPMYDLFQILFHSFVKNFPTIFGHKDQVILRIVYAVSLFSVSTFHQLILSPEQKMLGFLHPPPHGGGFAVEI